MKKSILAVLVLCTAILAGGCVNFRVEAGGHLPKASEIYVGETIVTHDGKLAEPEYAAIIVSAWEAGVREYMPKHGFRVVDKPGPDTLVLKAVISDRYSIWYGLGAGILEVRVRMFGRGGTTLLPIEVVLEGAVLSKFVSTNADGVEYSGTAYTVRKLLSAGYMPEKLKELFL